VLGRLTPADLGRRTRLPAWDVAHLVAHVYRAFERIPIGLASAPPAGPPDADRVTYWRSYDRAENGVQTAARADAILAEHGSQGIVAAFDRLWRDALDVLDAAPADRLVVTWQPVMRLDEFAATRLVEIGVHGLDLTAALDQAPALGAEAALAIGVVLRALAPDLDPDALGWHAVDWIEKATGRTGLSPAECRQLDDRAALFPVLS